MLGGILEFPMYGAAAAAATLVAISGGQSADVHPARPLPDPEEPIVKANDRLGPRDRLRTPGAVAGEPYRGDDELVFGHPEKGTPLDPSKLSRLYLRPALRRRGSEAVPALARPPPHGAHARGGGREPAGVRPAEGGPLARLDHRALHPRRAGALPGPGRPRREAHVRGGSRVSGPEKAIAPSPRFVRQREAGALRRNSQLPGLDSNQQPSG